MARGTLYQDVVAVTYDYLGPAADRFVTRQIRMHLQKEPEQLGRKDLRALVDWIRIAMSLISDDNELVEEYIAALSSLTTAHAKQGTHAKHPIA